MNLQLLGNFLIYTALLSVASFIIMKLYSSIARRDVFRFERAEGPFGLKGLLLSAVLFFLNLLKYLVLFPLYIAAWSIFVAVTIYVLSSVSLHHALFVSALLAATTRVLAYVDRDLALELAKMVPLTFIFAILVQPSIFDHQILPRLWEIGEAVAGEAPIYIALIMVVEGILRLLYVLVGGKPATSS